MNIPLLPANCMLLVEVGSTAHGTGLPDAEDRDEMGIVIESPSQVFGFVEERSSKMYRTKPDGVRSEPGDIDRTLHTLRKFLRLAASGNPSIMMCLWSPVIHCARPYGFQLRDPDFTECFVGRHIIPKYRGYMYSQASRLLGIGGGKHGKRGGGQRPEVIAEHGFDTKYAMHCSRLGFQCIEILETGKLTLPIQGNTGQWLRDLRAGKVSFKEWWDVTLGLDSLCQEMAKNESIPPLPQRQRIIQFSADTHMGYWTAREMI